MINSTRILYWAPRILCILAILLVSMFALDSFSPELTVAQQLKAFLIHLIPGYILTILLLIAWKWEYIGGILLSVVGLIGCYLVFTMNYHRTHSDFWASSFITLIIAFPFIIVGILFIISSGKQNR